MLKLQPLCRVYGHQRNLVLILRLLAIGIGKQGYVLQESVDGDGQRLAALLGVLLKLLDTVEQLLKVLESRNALVGLILL